MKTLAIGAFIGLVSFTSPIGFEARLGGVVVDDATGSPIKGAIVLATSAASRYAALSDGNGRFEFALPDGQYRLMASKVAYLSRGYGSRLPDRNGVLLTLAAKSSNRDIELRLLRSGVIAGRVVLGDEGLSGIAVEAVQAGTNSQSTVSSGAQFPRDETDRNGNFRLSGLSPGTYFVVATPYYGDGIGPVLGSGDRPNGPVQILGPTYYPGVADSSTASPISITPGSSEQGLVLPLKSFPAGNVHGTLSAAVSGPVSDLDVHICSEGPVLASSVRSGPTLSKTGNAFEIAGLLPGNYTVVASGTSRGERLSGAVHLKASAGAMSSVTLTLEPAMDLGGRLYAEAQLDFRDVRVGLRRVEAAGSCAELDVPSVTVSSGGSFVARNLRRGIYEVTIAPSQEYWLTSVRINGTQSESAIVSIEPATQALDLILTKVDSGISGMLDVPTGVVVEDYSVIIFPRDPNLWTDSRRVRLGHPDPSGAFRISRIPPGQYFVAICTDVSGADLAGLLPSIEPFSVKADVARGVFTVVNLKIAAGPY